MHTFREGALRPSTWEPGKSPNEFLKENNQQSKA